MGLRVLRFKVLRFRVLGFGFGIWGSGECGLLPSESGRWAGLRYQGEIFSLVWGAVVWIFGSEVSMGTY